MKHMAPLLGINLQSQEWERPVADSEKGVGFFQNTIVRTLMTVSLLLALLSFGVVAYFIRPSESLLVLHYNVYFGVDMLGVWWQAYILPVINLFFFAGHLLLAKRFYMRAERIASYLLLLSAGFLGLAVLVAALSVAFINY